MMISRSGPQRVRTNRHRRIGCQSASDGVSASTRSSPVDRATTAVIFLASNKTGAPVVGVNWTRAPLRMREG